MAAETPLNTSPTTEPACMVKSIRFFSNPIFINQKASAAKYRNRFEEAEVGYLYWDIEFINLFYKKQDSKVTFRLRCSSASTGAEMYAQEKTLDILSTQITRTANYSWGVEAGGYWKADEYIWVLVLNGNIEYTRTFTIDKMGRVTRENNPYFDVLGTRVFPGYADNREATQGYRYVSQFNVAETEYVGIEIDLNRKFSDKRDLELIVTIVDSSSGITYLSENYETSFEPAVQFSTVYARFRQGFEKNSFWIKGTYNFYISFMDLTIASGQFVIGDEEIAGNVQPLNGATSGIAAKTSVETQELSVEAALAELDELTGMTELKKAIRENVEYLKFNKLRMEKGFLDDSASNLHCIFTGNPGTGKTTVAHLLGKIYRSMGLLRKGHVIDATRADLIGEYIGQTAPKTKAMIEKARGGILFIDEIYSLVREGSKNDFGAEAIEILLVEMSNGKGDIAIVGAGYPAEVDQFLNFNPGLKSRFGNCFHFEDYMPDELMEISNRALKMEQASLSDDAKTELGKRLTSMYRNRDKAFGNARLPFSIIDEAKKQMGIRLMKLSNLNDLPADDLCKIQLEDLLKVFDGGDQKKLRLVVNKDEIDASLLELNGLVGLQAIKQEIRDKVNLVQFYSETGKDILNKFSLHAILTGNPGTGKTTLARLLGKIYKALGLLERGHVVEVDRQDLVAGYVGQTALKTAEAINKAMGGVLFIDEAYSLAGNGTNDFGGEAIETLLKMMEDHRGKFSVIVAGYTDNMGEFVRSNPGLQSRFDATYNLPDYTCPELLQIARNLLAAQELTLQGDASQYLSDYLSQAYDHRDKFFGNARFVRQAVETIVTRQNLRMAALPSAVRTPEMMKQVLLTDVETLQVQVQANAQRQAIGFKTH